MRQEGKIPKAGEIMQRRLLTLSPDTDLATAIRSLLAEGHSGAPVVDSSGRLVGVLSEHDCVSVLAQAAADKWPLGSVGASMTKEVETVSPVDDVFALATRFCQGHHRRLIVVEEGKLVGLISRRDLLRALESLEKGTERVVRQSTYEAIQKRHIALD
jgi:CBS domain-containing protein